MKKLVIIRHGESEWNQKNLFTGWVDVELSEKGKAEAKRAGELMKEAGLDFDVCYTSYLKRAINTQQIALKVMEREWLPVIKSWRLNERHYGALSGLNKKETAEKYGDEQVHIWRRSFDVRPPQMEEDNAYSARKNPAYRAVPDGDEYDKDVALALRYAVDNGAKVINTSFGKGFSPHKEWVYDAIKYAASKDVLIVNAAGNDSQDIDVKDTYPNDEVNKKEISDNFLTVGALNYEYNKNLVASFSNYGKRNVDVFAPGVKIYSTTPENKYEFLQGTSMASPEVAGVAALLRSYFPSLSAAEVKKIIMDSGVKVNMSVYVGEDKGDGKKRPEKNFSELSTTGTIVNAKNAVIMAAKMANVKLK